MLSPYSIPIFIPINPFQAERSKTLAELCRMEVSLRATEVALYERVGVDILDQEGARLYSQALAHDPGFNTRQGAFTRLAQRYEQKRAVELEMWESGKKILAIIGEGRF